MNPKLNSRSFELTLAKAIQAHQAGNRGEALPLYESALKQDPRHAHALYLYGALLWEMGKPADAMVALEKLAAARAPDLPTHALMGAVYSALGRHNDAVTHFALVAQATPQSPDALHNLGRAQRAAKDYLAAAKSFETAIRLKGPSAEVLTDLGLVLDASGDKQAAVKVYQDCVARFPSYQAVYTFLAQTLMALGDDVQAEAVLKAWLSIAPGDPEALLVLGVLYTRMARLPEAEASLRAVIAARPKEALPYAYLSGILNIARNFQEAERLARKAYSLEPNNAEVLTNLGLVLQSIGQPEEATAFQRRAVEANPRLSEAWNNLGLCLHHGGEVIEAIGCYERAIALKPQFHGAISNKAHALLVLGRLREGFAAYGSRFFQKHLASKRREFHYPLWDGKASNSIRLLLWTDQGLGDEVLYASMLGDLEKCIGECMLECSARMVPLFQRSFKWIKTVPRKSNPLPIIEDFRPTHQLPLIELGGIYRPDIPSIVQHQGYLVPKSEQVAALRARYLSIASGRKIVGISWKSENPNTGHFKSISLDNWAPVIKSSNAIFVSLQYGSCDGELVEASGRLGGNIVFDERVNALEAPDHSAAQIAAMDLVITTSNTTAHFAGAMNVPVWTLVPTGPGALWYWFLSRCDSPWYPSMTLFRQTRPGDWSDVMASVSMQFERWLNS
jgi:tetratricopeptide (TPR) repeat protein